MDINKKELFYSGLFYAIIINMDTVSKETRSKIMRRVKSQNTAPELFIRKAIWRAGMRYRKNYKELSGTPDLYISKYKTVIFIHGCFWHRHEGCQNAGVPKSNTEFWLQKFSKNAERDEQNRMTLMSSGLQVIVIWECTVRKMMKNPIVKEETFSKILDAIKNGENLYYEF